MEFVEYEAAHGRECSIECDNADTLAQVHHALQNRTAFRTVPRPALITECTACPVRKGCETEFVCHTASILACGSLLSALRARNVPACLQDRVIYVKNDCRDIWDWSEKVYQVIEKRNQNDHCEKI